MKRAPVVHTIPRDELAYLMVRTFRPLTLGLRSFEARPVRKALGAVPRAVLDVLRQVWPRPVPFIARILLIERQQVQRAVNELLARKLVVNRPNPRHLRSTMFELTVAGRAELKTYWTEETRRLRMMLAPFSDGDLEVARSVLEHLRIEFSALHAPEPADRMLRVQPPKPPTVSEERSHARTTMSSGWSYGQPERAKPLTGKRTSAKRSLTRTRAPRSSEPIKRR